LASAKIACTASPVATPPGNFLLMMIRLGVGNWVKKGLASHIKQKQAKK